MHVIDDPIVRKVYLGEKFYMQVRNNQPTAAHEPETVLQSDDVEKG